MLKLRRVCQNELETNYYFYADETVFLILFYPQSMHV